MTGTTKTARNAGGRTLPALLAIAALGACEASRATDLPTAQNAAREAAAQAAARDLSATPVAIPYTNAPAIVNREEIIEATIAGYPALLRDAGIGGTVRIYFFIDAEGIVQNALVAESSGHPAIDRAALGVAEAYRFRPAMNGTEPTPVWLSLPVTFTPR
jgi:TonB family protein